MLGRVTGGGEYRSRRVELTGESRLIRREAAAAQQAIRVRRRRSATTAAGAVRAEDRQDDTDASGDNAIPCAPGIVTATPKPTAPRIPRSAASAHDVGERALLAARLASA